MAKPPFLFLFLLATFFLPPLNTNAAEQKQHPMLPPPAPIAAALDGDPPVPLNQFLSSTGPSANTTAIHSAKRSTTSDTTPSPESPSSSLINQLVEQNFAEPSGAFGPAFNQILNGLNDNTSNNQTYDGLRQFWHIDVINSVTSIGSFISNFINNLTSVYLPYLVGCLCAIVKSFFLNIDLTTVQDAAASNDLSNMLYQLANTIYGIALDLSLLLFILSIWRYWTQAAWHGSGSPMSAVGRLIATIALMLAWTTIYKFEIRLSNEMLSALFPDNTGQIQFFDLIMSNLLHQTSAYPTTAGLLAAVPATEYVPAANGIMQGIIALAPIVVSVILVFLAIVLIYELLYLIVLKAIQTALLTAQYVFAPFFLVFLSNPVTDNIASSFLRSFVEVSLWNFIWIGLLKVLIILLYSNFNPWGKILTAIGVLQLMMQVPQFLAHAKISMASDFVSPHFFAKALKDISSYDDKIKTGTENLRQFFTGQSPHANHKEKLPASMPNKDTFSFAGNDPPNTDLQPPKKLNPLNGQSTNTNTNSTQNTNPDKSKGAGYGSFTAGSTNTRGSASTTTMATGGSFAYASANSIANALSIAIATVTNSSGGSSPNPTQPDPHSPKPGPSNPNGDRSGPKPNSNPPKPNFGSNPNSTPPPPKPGLNFGSNSGSNPSPQKPEAFFGPNPSSNPPPPKPDSYFGSNSGSSPLPPKPYSTPPNTDNHLSPSKGNAPPTDSGQKTKLSNYPDPQNPSDPVNNLSQLKYLLDKQERNVSAHNFASTTPGNSGQAISYELPELSLETGGNEATKIANSSKTSPQIALNQTQAFQFGALNYHLLKNGSRASHSSSSFYHPLRTYGAAGGLFSHYAYDLIFNHGNSPPLMGIPPIYPAPN